ncbi:MAG: hypothetical protein ACU0GG_18590 [Paracoccaceae bacterium]
MRIISPKQFDGLRKASQTKEFLALQDLSRCKMAVQKLDEQIVGLREKQFSTGTDGFAPHADKWFQWTQLEIARLNQQKALFMAELDGLTRAVALAKARIKALEKVERHMNRERTKEIERRKYYIS